MSTTAHHTSTTGSTSGDPRATGDPRIGWSGTADTDRAPVLRHRRDGILPTIGAALSVRGQTLTGTASKAEQPPTLHPLVQDFLDTLATDRRYRFTGRCPEAVLLSRHLTAVEANRGKRASRKPLTNGEARRSLKHSKITARHIREDGDPEHGNYAPPCRSCDALLAHFGVMPIGASTPQGS
ncbi:YwqJ-related putative deaminase [Streptomyces sp. CT34]|uniref:YwqJ-related putative deaminase n=1 Tax=Streptomyces sp. CT34 TaxID=1553907 RepID=UPI0005BBD521|nr:YwqJ-related putative deaminase [Streptomyces sp. CT34]